MNKTEEISISVYLDEFKFAFDTEDKISTIKLKMKKRFIIMNKYSSALLDRKFRKKWVEITLYLSTKWKIKIHIFSIKIKIIIFFYIYFTCTMHILYYYAYTILL